MRKNLIADTYEEVMRLRVVLDVGDGEQYREKTKPYEQIR